MAVYVLIAVKVKGKVVCMSKYLTVKMHREHGVESMGECTSHMFLCFI